MTNWEKFVHYMHVECGMQYEPEEEFVVCCECQDPIYKQDFAHWENDPHIFCPCCEYDIETENCMGLPKGWEEAYPDEMDEYDNYEEEEEEW
jgi:hypothetical protein